MALLAKPKTGHLQLDCGASAEEAESRRNSWRCGLRGAAPAREGPGRGSAGRRREERRCGKKRRRPEPRREGFPFAAGFAIGPCAFQTRARRPEMEGAVARPFSGVSAAEPNTP